MSYVRRPLALLTLGYIALLMALRSWGWLETSPPAEWIRLTREPCLRVEGKVVSGFAENRMGERVQVRAQRASRCSPWATSRYDGERSGGYWFPRNYERSSSRDNEGLAPPMNEVPLPRESGALPRPQEADLMVYLPKDAPENDALRPGQTVALEGTLRRTRWPRMPGDFDERQYLADRDVSFVFRALRVEAMPAAVPWRWLPAYWAEAAHRSIHRRLRGAFPPDAATVMEGLMLGYKGPLDPGINEAIQDAGVMHLLVPSGAKVVFVLAFVWWLSGIFGFFGFRRLLAAAVVGGFYVLMVGAGPPYLRAYLGAVIAGLARVLEREAGGFQALVLSALTVLIAHPRDLFSAGFQMSYAAVLGLLIAMPRWAAPLRWPAWLRGSLAVLAASFVVQLMLGPIMAGIFGRVSFIGLLANIVLIPVSGLFVAGGFMFWVASLAGLDGVGHALAWLLGGMVEVFVWVCGAFAALPAAAIRVRPMACFMVVAYYLGVLGVLTLPERRTSILACGAAACLAAGAFVAGHWKERETRIVFLDQRAGSASGWRAVLACLPDGRRFWFSRGAPSAVAVARILDATGTSKLDGVLFLGPQAGLWNESELAGRVGEVSVLQEGTTWVRDGISARYPAHKGAEYREKGNTPHSRYPPLVLRAGDAWVESTAALDVSAVSFSASSDQVRGEEVEFCILQSPSRGALRLSGANHRGKERHVAGGAWRISGAKHRGKGDLAPGGNSPARDREKGSASLLAARGVPEVCASERTFDTGKDGAVWVISDGRRHKIATQDRLYSLGRSVP